SAIAALRHAPDGTASSALTTSPAIPSLLAHRRGAAYHEVFGRITKTGSPPNGYSATAFWFPLRLPGRRFRPCPEREAFILSGNTSTSLSGTASNASKRGSRLTLARRTTPMLVGLGLGG